MTTSRLTRCCRTVGIVALASALLSSCGTDLNPGTAATVNGTTISQGEVDGLVQSACEYSRLSRIEQGGAEPSTSVADLRRFFTNSLIQFDLTDAAAAKLHLRVSAADVAKATTDIQIPDSLQGDDRDTLVDYFDDAGRAQAEHQLIGAHVTDPSVTSLDQVTSDTSQAADAYMKKFSAQQDVTVNPSYGRWTGSGLVAASGSLSAPVSAPAKAFLKPSNAQGGAAPDLPASQLCG